MFTKLKEPISGLTHLAGALLAIAALFVMIVTATHQGNIWHLVSMSIFGSSMILLYSASSLYHLLPLSEQGSLILKKIDHMMIFVLIAGTYTPICLIALRGAWGWSLFGIVWGLTLLGIIKKLVWIQSPRWLSTGIYLLMGWLCVIAIVPLVRALPFGGIFWIFLGGGFYSAGAVIYALKRPDPFPNIFGFHEVWHLFVMAGTFSHFWAIYKYLMLV